MIPYDEDILTYTQDGHLLDLVSHEFRNVLAPLVDYVVTGDCWEDYDVQKQFDAYVTKKKRLKKKHVHRLLLQLVSPSLKIRILFVY